MRDEEFIWNLIKALIGLAIIVYVASIPLMFLAFLFFGISYLGGIWLLTFDRLGMLLSTVTGLNIAVSSLLVALVLLVLLFDRKTLNVTSSQTRKVAVGIVFALLVLATPWANGQLLVARTHQEFPKIEPEHQANSSETRKELGAGHPISNGSENIQLPPNEIQVTSGSDTKVQISDPPANSPSSAVKDKPKERPYSTNLTNNLPDPKEVQLTDEHLKGIGGWALTVYRNEIYARHGRVFNDPELRTLFKKQSWYQYNPNYRDSLLSPLEVKNAAFILNYQQRKSLMY